MRRATLATLATSTALTGAVLALPSATQAQSATYSNLTVTGASSLGGTTTITGTEASSGGLQSAVVTSPGYYYNTTTGTVPITCAVTAPASGTAATCAVTAVAPASPNAPSAAGSGYLAGVRYPVTDAAGDVLAVLIPTVSGGLQNGDWSISYNTLPTGTLPQGPFKVGTLGGQIPAFNYHVTAVAITSAGSGYAPGTQIPLVFGPASNDGGTNVAAYAIGTASSLSGGSLAADIGGAGTQNPRSGGTVTYKTLVATRRVSVLDFVQPGDPDDTAAFNRALNVAGSLNLPLYVPSTRHFKVGAACAQINIPVAEHAITIEGDGKGQSWIDWDSEQPGCTSGSANTGNPMFNLYNGASIGPHLDYLTIKGITFKGNFEEGSTSGSSTTAPFTQNERIAFNIYGVAHARLSDVEVTDMPYFSWAATNSTDNIVEDSWFHEDARDTVDGSSNDNLWVVDNRFEHIDDDAISPHNTDGSSNNPLFGHTNRWVHVIGNTFTDTGACFDGGGAMHLVFTNNISDRTKGSCVSTQSIQQSTSFIDIENNQMTNIINTGPITGTNSGSWGIWIGGVAYKGSLTTVPGTPDPTSGVITQPYPWTYVSNPHDGSSNPDNQNAQAGAYGIRIAHNLIGQTLPVGSPYLSWGLGEMFTRTGWLNPTVTPAILSQTQAILFTDYVHSLDISDNTIQGVAECVELNTGASYMGFTPDINVEGRIHDNSCRDFTQGFLDIANAPISALPKVENNDINGDPYGTSADRPGTNTDTWSQNPSVGSADLPAAVYWNGGVSSPALELDNNRMWNLMAVDSRGTASRTDYEQTGNVLFAQPASVGGWNANNGGIGYAPSAGDAYRYAVIDATRTDAAFGHVLTPAITEVPAMPSSGFWVAGTVLRDSAITSASSPATWIRLTTGSGNTLNTDWLAH